MVRSWASAQATLLDGDQARRQKGHSAPSPIFSAHVCCGQTAGWIKMPLGTEVGLSPGDIVLYGDPAHPLKKGHSSLPQFLVHDYCGQTAGWIKMPLGTEVGLGPGDIVLYGDPAPPPMERGTAAPTFWPVSIVAKQWPISATAELLLLSELST